MVGLPDSAAVTDALRAAASEEKRRVLSSFFKTGPGEYGEGDLFLGVTVPQVRRVAQEYNRMAREAGAWQRPSRGAREEKPSDAAAAAADEQTVCALLRSPLHEARLCALLIWVDRLLPPRTPLAAREHVYRLWRRHTCCINNWDLVDLSTPQIAGGYLLAAGMDDAACLGELEPLFSSENLWERRMALLATFALIRSGRPGPTLRLAERCLADRRDLIQKASGWMLREVGKRDEALLLGFLRKHHAAMPRTMFRYAVERLSPAQRAQITAP